MAAVLLLRAGPCCTLCLAGSAACNAHGYVCVHLQLIHAQAMQEVQHSLNLLQAGNLITLQDSTHTQWRTSRYDVELEGGLSWYEHCMLLVALRLG